MQYTVIFLYFSETLSKLETRGSQVQLNSTKHLVLEHILVWTKHRALSCKVTTQKKKKRLKKIEELQNHNRPAIPYTCILLSKYIPKGHNGKGRQEKNKGRRRRIFLLNFSRTKPSPTAAAPLQLGCTQQVLSSTCQVLTTSCIRRSAGHFAVLHCHASVNVFLYP